MFPLVFCIFEAGLFLPDHYTVPHASSFLTYTPVFSLHTLISHDACKKRLFFSVDIQTNNQTSLTNILILAPGFFFFIHWYLNILRSVAEMFSEDCISLLSLWLHEYII